MADDTGKEEREDEPGEDENFSGEASADTHGDDAPADSDPPTDEDEASTDAGDATDDHEAATDSDDAADEHDEPAVAAATADDDDESEYGGSRSEVDAMGQDKRREVVGQQYGATLRKRLLVYGGVVAVIVVVVIAFLTVVKGYDNRDVPLKDTAPWTEAGASQTPPRDVDFKANGPTDTIPAKDILNR